jgi:hypothetical protein
MTKTAELLKQDLAAIGITQKEFADRLTKLTGEPISQQAVSLWCQRDYIPPRRRGEIVEILGPDAMLSRMFASNTIADVRFSRKQYIEPIDTRDEGFDMRREPLFVRVKREVLRIIPGAHLERILMIGDYRRSFDYVSPRMVVSFIETTMTPRQPFHPFMIGRRLLNLALARKFHPEREALLALVGDDQSEQIAEVRFECQAFGVELLVFPDLETGIQYIAERENLETLPSADLDDSYL